MEYQKHITRMSQKATAIKIIARSTGILLLFLSPSLWGQNFQLNYSYGNVLKRENCFGTSEIIKTHSISTDLSWITDAPVYGNPEVGLTFNYQKYSSAGIENSYTAFAFMEREFAFGQSPLGIQAHFGIGIMLVEKLFDIETNPSCQSVSSHFNFGADARLQFYYRFHKNLKLGIGTSFFHASNMGIVKPNYGLNVPGAMISLNYLVKPTPPLKVNLSEERKKQEWIIYYNAGYRQIRYRNPIWFVHNLNFEYSRKISPIINLSGGISLFQESIANELQQYDDFYNFPEYQPFSLQQISAGIYAGPEIFFGKLSAFGQMGYYIYHPHREAMQRSNISKALKEYINYYNPVYIFNRFGFRYRAGNHLMFSISGKSQLAKILYMELGIGATF